MGKGDRRTKKGKIIKSSFGKSRPKKARNVKAGIAARTGKLVELEAPKKKAAKAAKEEE